MIVIVNFITAKWGGGLFNVKFLSSDSKDITFLFTNMRRTLVHFIKGLSMGCIRTPTFLQTSTIQVYRSSKATQKKILEGKPLVLYRHYSQAKIFLDFN